MAPKDLTIFTCKPQNHTKETGGGQKGQRLLTLIPSKIQVDEKYLNERSVLYRNHIQNQAHSSFHKLFTVRHFPYVGRVERFFWGWGAVIQ